MPKIKENKKKQKVKKTEVWLTDARYTKWEKKYDRWARIWYVPSQQVQMYEVRRIKHTHTHTHTHTSAIKCVIMSPRWQRRHSSTSIHTYKHISWLIYIYIYIYIYICMFGVILVCPRVCVCTNTHIGTHTHKYLYTHVFTQHLQTSKMQCNAI